MIQEKAKMNKEEDKKWETKEYENGLKIKDEKGLRERDIYV